MLSVDGKECKEITCSQPVLSAQDLGKSAAEQLLEEGGKVLVEQIRHGK
ncbi:MAG: hypothetical protein LUG51_05145 [Tannerellaceae bacterium]|nr:hypothetical protein [Tannerellaceae bacterium]